MRKKIAVMLLVVMFCASVSAITLSWSISIPYGLKMLGSFQAQDDTTVFIRVAGNEYSAEIGFRLDVQDPNESNQQYAKGRIGQIVDAFVQMHSNKLNTDIRTAAIADANYVDVSDPNGIVE